MNIKNQKSDEQFGYDNSAYSVRVIRDSSEGKAETSLSEIFRKSDVGSDHILNNSSKSPFYLNN